MNCQDTRLLLGLVDALPEGEAREAREHLEACPACRTRAEALAQALERVEARGAQLKAPRERAWAGIEKAIEQELPAEALPRARRRSRVPRPRRSVLLLCSGALLLSLSLIAALKLTVPGERRLSRSVMLEHLARGRPRVLGTFDSNGSMRGPDPEPGDPFARNTLKGDPNPATVNPSFGQRLFGARLEGVVEDSLSGFLAGRRLNRARARSAPLPFLKVNPGPNLFSGDSPDEFKGSLALTPEYLKLSEAQKELLNGLHGRYPVGFEHNDEPGKPILQRLSQRLEEVEKLALKAVDASKSMGLRTEKRRLENAIAALKGSWKPSRLSTNALRLMVGDTKALPLKGLQVQVRIDGFRARVLLDAFFDNPDDQRYEGSFQLRLPDGASPHFLAFGETVLKASEPEDLAGAFLPDVSDFDGARIVEQRSESWPQPKVARMVPREKAASAYKATVRRRVDPALLEWSGAGVFQARVFPLMPKKTHRIVLAYDLDLRGEGQDLALSLELPEAPTRIVDIDLAAIPGVETSLEPKADKARGRSFRFEGTKAGAISLRLKKPGALLLTGADRAGPRFAARVCPDLPDQPMAGRDRAVFLVDVSLSARHRYARDLKLLEGLLTENRDQIKEFAILFFNVERFWYRKEFTPNSTESVADAVAFAGALALEGATDLGAAIDAATAPRWSPGKTLGEADLFLLGDGAANWGASDLSAMRAHLQRPGVGALFAYRGAVGSDVDALNTLAQEKGGALFSAVSEADQARAVRAHRSRPWILEGVSIPGGEDLLIAGRPRVLFPGQELMVVGRGVPLKKRSLSLRLRQGSLEKTVLVPFAHRLEKSLLAARAYGQVAVAQLEGAPGAPEEASQSLALHYRVTGRRCSLLMLESEDDYKRHAIKTPELLAEAVSAEALALRLERFYAGEAKARDSKAAFIAFIGRLRGMPEMSFQLSERAYGILADLTAEAFEVRPAELRCLLRRRDALPEAFRAALDAERLDYDAVLSEAGARLGRKNPADAIRALSSLVESRPGDGGTRRDVAQTLLSWGQFGHAYHLLRAAAEARPFEPLPYLLMASGAAESGRLALAMAWYEAILAGEWDSRFGDFKSIAAQEYGRVLALIARGPADETLRRFAEERRAELAVGGESDLVVLLSWATDNTDIDLHVTEPGGEEVYFEHRSSKSGGAMSADVTGGYGPEMYRIEKAAKGAYRIEAVYYSDDANRAGTRSRALLTIIRNRGRANESITRQVLTFRESKERLRAASIIIE